MLATAFQLMSAFVLPSIAVRLLTERWADFAPALLAGINDDVAQRRWSEEPAPRRPFLMVEGVRTRAARRQIGQ